ncbi:uncharacterized protein [Typha latifolia]|uniref:uncharacterized protein n=1 Tax=Typha latifolia TaxID=4733 RepID=UPI003C2CFED2
MKIPTSAADDYASILRVANSQLHLQTQQLQKMDGTLLAAKKYQLREREQQTHQTAHIEGPAFDLFNDPPPEPMGERCELCRIDLAFRPLGSLDSYNRDIPVVAVLPCGHAFHDSCLEGISNRTNPSQTPICVCCLD